MTDTSQSLRLRAVAEQIFHRSLSMIDVENTVRSQLRLDGDRLSIGEEICDLRGFERIIVIALGKASLAMARAVDKILGDRVTDGLVVCNALIVDAPARLPVLIGGHPLPNETSFDAARRALDLLRRYDSEDTLVLFLISGGGSAMFELPIEESLTLDDLQEVNRALVECGAVINQINIVRRHLSAVKGGRLADAAPLSRQISLYISDVNSDDLTTVASGPTLPDRSTPEDLRRIVAKYNLTGRFPPAVVAVVESERVSGATHSSSLNQGAHSHHLLLDNRRALLEAKRIAESDFGMVVEIADDLVEGDVEEMVQIHLARIGRLLARSNGKTVGLFSGGEVVCPVRGSGQGGRNQEFVLRSALHLPRLAQAAIVVISAGTDGIDGQSPAAGAIADKTTISRAVELGLSPEDYLRNSDSFNFFRQLGDTIMTGPTGNNVRDLRILVAE